MLEGKGMALSLCAFDHPKRSLSSTGSQDIDADDEMPTTTVTSDHEQKNFNSRRERGKKRLEAADQLLTCEDEELFPTGIFYFARRFLSPHQAIRWAAEDGDEIPANTALEVALEAGD